MHNRQALALGSTLSSAERPELDPRNEAKRHEIDALNAEVYTHINNGAYKAGFSADQTVYAAAFTAYFLR